MRTPDPRRYADRIVFYVCCILTLALTTTTAYQQGYDTCRSEVKSLPKVEIPLKQMTHKQQVKWAKWANRDKGWIK